MQKLPVIIAFACIIVLSPLVSRAEGADTDGDGLNDQEETEIYHSDANNPDTDGDGYDDGLEIRNGYSPLEKGKKMTDVDSDKDYLNDDWEIRLGTGLKDPDSDGDKYLDGTEVAASYDPLDAEPKKVEKRIEVQVDAHRLQYYSGDKLLADIPISGGTKSMPTPKGSFEIKSKIPVKHYGGPGFDLPNTKWNMHFTTKKYNYYIHGAYWHDKFGKENVSHGCVNVAYANMERLYNWAQVGTKVHII